MARPTPKGECISVYPTRHDDAAFHYESAAHHHREAARHAREGRIEDARRHVDMAAHHAERAREHGARAAHLLRHGASPEEARRRSWSEASDDPRSIYAAADRDRYATSPREGWPEEKAAEEELAPLRVTRRSRKPARRRARAGAHRRA